MTVRPVTGDQRYIKHINRMALLRLLRREPGLSRAELAERSGLTPSGPMQGPLQVTTQGQAPAHISGQGQAMGPGPAHGAGLREVRGALGSRGPRDLQDTDGR